MKSLTQVFLHTFTKPVDTFPTHTDWKLDLWLETYIRHKSEHILPQILTETEHIFPTLS